MRSHQQGNVVIFILLAVGLFGALAYTFTRSGQQGQNNMTEQQAKIAAQEISDFVTVVNRAVQKLRTRGCSEADISFAHPNDTFAAQNDPASAPADKSCHVFEAAGGGIPFSFSLGTYQLPVERIEAISPGNGNQYGNINFRVSASNIGVGTSADELMAHLNFIKPEVCVAYNNFLGLSITKVADSGPIAGDENTSYVGLETFCRYSIIAGDVTYGQIRAVWIAR